jgi:hypothetical protein
MHPVLGYRFIATPAAGPKQEKKWREAIRADQPSHVFLVISHPVEQKWEDVALLLDRLVPGYFSKDIPGGKVGFVQIDRSVDDYDIWGAAEREFGAEIADKKKFEARRVTAAMAKDGKPGWVLCLIFSRNSKSNWFKRFIEYDPPAPKTVFGWVRLAIVIPLILLCITLFPNHLWSVVHPKVYEQHNSEFGYFLIFWAPCLLFLVGVMWLIAKMPEIFRYFKRNYANREPITVQRRHGSTAKPGLTAELTRKIEQAASDIAADIVSNSRQRIVFDGSTPSKGTNLERDQSQMTYAFNEAFNRSRYRPQIKDVGEIKIIENGKTFMLDLVFEGSLEESFEFQAFVDRTFKKYGLR